MNITKLREKIAKSEKSIEDWKTKESELKKTHEEMKHMKVTPNLFISVVNSGIKIDYANAYGLTITDDEARALTDVLKELYENTE